MVLLGDCVISLVLFCHSKNLKWWTSVTAQLQLSFIWGKMRTAAQETASQIALGDCSKVAVGESQYIRFQ